MPREGAEAGFWRKLLPGQYYEAHYVDDDVAHERLALWPVSRGLWVVHSADGDSWVEDVSGRDSETGPSHTYGFGPRGGRMVTRPPLYRFPDVVDEDSLRNLITEAIGLAEAEAPAGATRAPIPKHILVDADDRRTIARFMPDFRPPSVARLPVVEGHVWLLCEQTSDGNIGDEVQMDPAVDVIAGLRGFKQIDDEKVLVEKVASADVAGFVTSIHVRCRAILGDGRTEPERRGPRKLGGGTIEPAGQAGGDDDAVAADVRTLWVQWDEHGERWKDFRDAVRESSEEPFVDIPLEGTRTALHMARMMDRTAGCPRRWLEQWLRDKHIETGDRVAHEMRVLTETLRTSACYDQLNIGSVVALEILCRRIATMVEAFSDPNRPNWSNARYYAGTPSADEVIHPALRTQVNKKAKEEAELASSRARTAGVRGQPFAGDDSGGADGDSPTGGGRGGRDKGKGRGRAGGQAPGVAPARP